MAASTGHCNTCLKFLCWGMVLQGLSGPLVELTLDLGKAGLCLTSREGKSLCLETIVEACVILDQRDTGYLQLFEITLIFSCGRVGKQIQSRSHPSQHPGIHCIGFCPCALSLRKAARLKRVDLHQRQTPGKSLFKTSMVGTRWFVNQQIGRAAPDPAFQCFEPSWIVGKPG